MSDQHKLLAQARHFDQDALSQIHDEYYAPIFRYALYRTGDRETAEDIASEVFTRLLQGLRSGAGPKTTFVGWLFGVAARVVSDHFRQAFRTPAVELDDVLTDYDDTPSTLTCSLDQSYKRSYNGHIKLSPMWSGPKTCEKTQS